MEITGLDISQQYFCFNFWHQDKERIQNGKKRWGYDAHIEAAIIQQLAKRHVLGQSNIDWHRNQTGSHLNLISLEGFGVGLKTLMGLVMPNHYCLYSII